MQPEDLKRTEPFPHAFRGYAAEEVDAYVEEILGKYEELYRENRELVQHLRVWTKREKEIKDVKAEADARLEAATAEAKRILLRAKADGDIIRARAEKEAAAREAKANQKLDRLREETAAFFARVTGEYADATARLTAIANDCELPEAPALPPETEAIEMPAPPLPADEYTGSETVDAPEAEDNDTVPLSEDDEFARVYGNANYVSELRRTPRRHK